MLEERIRRSRRWRHAAGASALIAVFSFAAAWGGSSSAGAAGGGGGGACTPAKSPVVTLAAYSNPYVAYGKITTNFATEWKDAHDGQSIDLAAVVRGSTTQATNIVNGFKADIYASSTGPDVQMVRTPG